jgi:hypothetical protein
MQPLSQSFIEKNTEGIMVDYEAMYEVLLEGIASAIEEINHQNYRHAKDILMKSQQAAEVVFLESVNKELKACQTEKNRGSVKKTILSVI